MMGWICPHVIVLCAVLLALSPQPLDTRTCAAISAPGMFMGFQRMQSPQKKYDDTWSQTPVAMLCHPQAQNSHCVSTLEFVQVLLQLPEELATTLLRTAVAPPRNPPFTDEPPLLSLPDQLNAAPQELFPLVLHACAPCISTHRVLAMRPISQPHHVGLVAALPQLTTLTALTIVVPRLEVADVDLLQLMHAAQRLPHLTRMSITDEESNSQRAVSFTVGLAAAPRLQSLTLKIPGEPYGMGPLFHALQQRQMHTLRALELCCALTDVHTDQLAVMLPVLTVLQDLTIRDARFSHEDAAAVVSAVAALPGVTRLELDNVLRFRDSAEGLCAAIGRVGSLHALRLREAPGGILQLIGLGEALQHHISACSHLTSLDLSTNMLRESLRPLGQLLRSLPRLRCLSVHGALRLCDDIGGVRIFAAGLRQLQGLTRLSLKGCVITVPVAMEIAPALAALCALRVLRIDSACMETMYSSWAEPAGVIAPVLQRMSALEDICLDSCALGVEGIAEVAVAVSSMPWLRQLRLRNNSIGVAGVQTLVPALARLTRLQLLDLSVNAVMAEDVAVLASCFRVLGDLRELNLSHNPLKPAGAAALAAGVSELATIPAELDEGGRECCNDLGEPPGGLQPCDGAKRMDHVPPADPAAVFAVGGGPQRGAQVGCEHAAAAQTALLRLERLLLEGCGFGATGLAALAPAVLGMLRLRELWLDVDGMRSAAADQVAAQLLAKNPALFLA